MKTDGELLKSLEGMPKPGTLWRHYKGSLYVVVGSALQESTCEPLVLYQRVNGEWAKPVWARPRSEWFGVVVGTATRFKEEPTP